MKLRIAVLMAIFISVVFAGASLFAFSSGYDGRSGNPATNGGQTCNQCHSGGITPTVSIDGPAIVLPGDVATYTLTISGGQEVAGGFDVSAISGTLSPLPGAMDVYLRGVEVTHTEPKPVDGAGEVAFSFQWTAPTTPTLTTLYGAGNSVNLADGSRGDRANTAVRMIAVGTFTETLYLPLVSR